MNEKDIKSLINMVLLAGLFAFCISSGNTAYCSHGVLRDNLYLNTDHNFKINFPEKWEVAKGVGVDYIVNAEEPGGFGISININIEKTDPGYTADMLSVKDVGYITYGLGNTFSNIVLVKSSETHISNRKALMIMCSYTTTMANMIMVQYITIDDGNIFTLTCIAPSDQYDEYEEIFTNSISTFMFGDFIAEDLESEYTKDELIVEQAEVIEEYQEKEQPEKEVLEKEVLEKVVLEKEVLEREEPEKEEQTYERSTRTDYGLKDTAQLNKIADKRLLETYVKDQADVIDVQTENKLNTYIEILENKTGTQMMVFTTNTIGKTPIRQFSNDLMEKWGSGQTNKKNAVLIVVVVNDKKYSIKINSDLKAKLPNKFCVNIGKTLFVPNFANGNYNQGIYQGVITIINKIVKEEISKVHAKGDIVTLHNPENGTVGMYKTSSLIDLVFLFTDGIEAEILEMKISDLLPVLYKVQVWDYIGWVTEKDISG